ncbi:MAG: cysteine--tRNA ligase [Candidatus Paceibacterota bacterium]|jgi:cysteinyl-tRNA synthetase
MIDKSLYLYNTLTRNKDIFKPIKEGEVGLYTCGPTVYNFPHIGNMRTYIFEDLLKRVLQYNGYKVKHIMNITDVGHLTNDQDMGEDKIEKEAKKEGKTAWDIAEFYTEAFKKDLGYLNIIYPDIFCKATDNIKEQIDLILKLEEKGYTYKTSDGIYFDTSKVSDYTKLSGQKIDQLREGARVEINNEKKNPTDFALWKFSPKDTVRQMEWPSPYGVGFPGWHIECSAMSMKYLGEQFDIHCGGIDHVNIHHTNEIAQTESATGKKPWVNYWIHGAFLNIKDGEKMAKSSGNFLTVESTFVNKNINPLVYRFSTLNTHYRKSMEWSEEIMNSAKNGLENLYSKISKLGKTVGKVNEEWKEKFTSAINDDLNISQAIGILNEMLKSDISNEDKFATALDFDKVFGLKFDSIKDEVKVEIPEEVKKLVEEREEARKAKDWAKSDEIRAKIATLGYEVKDMKEGPKIVIK